LVLLRRRSRRAPCDDKSDNENDVSHVR
jgi:hypothetical protein